MFGALIGVSRLHIKVATSCESFGFPKILKQCVFQESHQSRVGLYKVEARNYSIWRTFVPKKWSGIKRTSEQACCSRQILLTRPSILQYFRNKTATILNAQTNVKNNVMLYRYEKPYMFKLASVFGIVAFIGCYTMADLVYKVLCKGLFVPDVPLMDRLIQHALPLMAIITGIISGPAIACTIYFITIRTVKYIILLKGGQEIALVTYHPIREKIKTIALKDVSAVASRDCAKAYVPVKIKGYKYNFLLDKNGHFVNPELYDNTVGVCRFK